MDWGQRPYSVHMSKGPVTHDMQGILKEEPVIHNAEGLTAAPLLGYF